MNDASRSFIRRLICLSALAVAAGNVPQLLRAEAPESWPAGLSDAPSRVEAIETLADGLTANDSEAINGGWQGNKGWAKATAVAEAAAGKARDPGAFGLVLRTLYASYPSLHSHSELRADIDYRSSFGAPYIPFMMKVSIVAPGIEPTSVFLSSVSEDLTRVSGARPAAGDRVVAINGRPISHWLSRTAAVCRRNSRWQCYGDFDKQLRNGLLGWDPRRVLRVDLVSHGRRETATYRPQAIPGRSDMHAQTGCETDDTRYQGFSRIYAGWNLCVFGSSAKPGVEIWRLRSFSYPANATVDSPKSEVARFWEEHWKTAAPSVSKLIIDVSGNGGGDVPMAWYSLILDKPYQEQYAEYRRLKAYDDPAVANELPGDEAHAKWLASLRQRGSDGWRRIGGFLSAVPMFCADEDKNCDGRLLLPKANGFKGTVSLIIDDNCVSSCSGFSWNILSKLGARAAAFGLPDSGDSNFKRLPLKLYYSGDKWHTSVGASSAVQEKPIATVSVMVTRTVTRNGQVISGKSQPVHTVIGRLWNDTANSWASRALAAAMR